MITDGKQSNLGGKSLEKRAPEMTMMLMYLAMMILSEK